MLAVEDLSLRFGGVTALAGVSFSVGPGERVGLTGPNGAGKTSVLDCISGVARPAGGRILLDGRDLAGVGPAQRAALGIARTLQGLGVVDALDVMDNLLLGRHHRMRSGLAGAALRLRRARAEETAERARCVELAARLGLDPASRAADLTAGARKRLELGRALAMDGVLLLLDEPFAGAAPADVDLMVAAIRRATTEGGGPAAAVIVDHDVATVLALADRIVALDAGRLVA